MSSNAKSFAKNDRSAPLDRFNAFSDGVYAIAITLLVLGCVMDATAIIVALTPLVAPIAAQYGIHELQFGLVFVFTCMVGLVTPPVGVVLFMVCALVNISMETLSRAILPFVIWMVFVVALLIFVPPITLFLPGLVGFR